MEISNLLRMNILVTGSKGYIGTVLMKELEDHNYKVKGLDSGYFSDCLVKEIQEEYDYINKDIRDITLEDLNDVDSIIHLAALSNDPLGEFNYELTQIINFKSTINLAKLAKQKGISRFVYVSSQSMYGISDTNSELEEDNSKKLPITAYAKTKWAAECELKKLVDSNFTVVCFRPSTVFGFSPRLRCDIVFNSFVGCAFTTGKIEVKSDGTPWRPVIHIKDVCQALIAGLKAPSKIVNGRSYNIGLHNGNFTVRQLAESAARSVPGSKLIFTGEHGKDSRTYRVSFARIHEELGEWYHPSWTLDKGAKELVDAFIKYNFSEEDFRGLKTNRLLSLKNLTLERKIDSNLRWI